MKWIFYYFFKSTQQIAERIENNGVNVNAYSIKVKLDTCCCSLGPCGLVKYNTWRLLQSERSQRLLKYTDLFLWKIIYGSRLNRCTLTFYSHSSWNIIHKTGFMLQSTICHFYYYFPQSQEFTSSKIAKKNQKNLRLLYL